MECAHSRACFHQPPLPFAIPQFLLATPATHTRWRAEQVAAVSALILGSRGGEPPLSSTGPHYSDPEATALSYAPIIAATLATGVATQKSSISAGFELVAELPVLSFAQHTPKRVVPRVAHAIAAAAPSAASRRFTRAAAIDASSSQSVQLTEAAVDVQISAQLRAALDLLQPHFHRTLARHRARRAAAEALAASESRKAAAVRNRRRSCTGSDAAAAAAPHRSHRIAPTRLIFRRRRTAASAAPLFSIDAAGLRVQITPALIAMLGGMRGTRLMTAFGDALAVVKADAILNRYAVPQMIPALQVLRFEGARPTVEPASAASPVMAAASITNGIQWLRVVQVSLQATQIAMRSDSCNTLTGALQGSLRGGDSGRGGHSHAAILAFETLTIGGDASAAHGGAPGGGAARVALNLRGLCLYTGAAVRYPARVSAASPSWQPVDNWLSGLPEAAVSNGLRHFPARYHVAPAAQALSAGVSVHAMAAHRAAEAAAAAAAVGAARLRVSSSLRPGASARQQMPPAVEPWVDDWTALVRRIVLKARPDPAAVPPAAAAAATAAAQKPRGASLVPLVPVRGASAPFEERMGGWSPLFDAPFGATVACVVVSLPPPPAGASPTPEPRHSVRVTIVLRKLHVVVERLQLLSLAALQRALRLKQDGGGSGGSGGAQEAAGGVASPEAASKPSHLHSRRRAWLHRGKAHVPAHVDTDAAPSAPAAAGGEAAAKPGSPAELQQLALPKLSAELRPLLLQVKRRGVEGAIALIPMPHPSLVLCPSHCSEPTRVSCCGGAPVHCSTRSTSCARRRRLSRRRLRCLQLRSPAAMRH